MLSEKDLIYFGAIMLWQSSSAGATMNSCINTAQEFYDKIFKEDE